MNLTTAFTIFVKQAIREQGIPFEITRETLNGEILAAFKEVEEMKKNSTLARCYTAQLVQKQYSDGQFFK